MYKFVEYSNSFIFISIGAALGAYFRMQVHHFAGLLFSRKYLGTIIINNLSTFLLGLIISYNIKNDFFELYQSYRLAICVGFLGSLSTFSTFVIELLDSLFKKKWTQFFLIYCLSIFGGMFAAFIGYKIGNASF